MNNASPFSESTIVIVTKNRATQLEKCLLSLSKQQMKPKEVCVIDNDSTDNTRIVANSFSKILPIRYSTTSAFGYPLVYNFGISQASGRWIIFLDDDCTVLDTWSFELNKEIQRHPDLVLQGRTLSKPDNNIYATVMGMHYRDWVTSNMIGANKLRTFDNKNLCIPAHILKKYGVFDTDLIFGSEDIELGARYYRNGVCIRYCPNILAYHTERTSLRTFLSQHIRIAKSEAIVDQKLQKNETTAGVYIKKIGLHVQGATKLGWAYMRNGDVKSLVTLCLLYVLLAVIRLWTYHMTVWLIKK